MKPCVNQSLRQTKHASTWHTNSGWQTPSHITRSFTDRCARRGQELLSRSTHEFSTIFLRAVVTREVWLGKTKQKKHERVAIYRFSSTTGVFHQSTLFMVDLWKYLANSIVGLSSHKGFKLCPRKFFYQLL